MYIYMCTYTCTYIYIYCMYYWLLIIVITIYYHNPPPPPATCRALAQSLKPQSPWQTWNLLALCLQCRLGKCTLIHWIHWIKLNNTVVGVVGDRQSRGLATHECNSLADVGPDQSEVWYQKFSGWWFEPLWNILVSWDYYSQYMDK